MVPPNSRVFLLASYAYLRKSPELCDAVFAAVSGGATLLIDCGAHTVYQAKAKGQDVAPIDLKAYCQFLKANDSSIWQAIALDVVKDRPATEANLQFMLDAGLRPMPVMVYGMPEEAALDLVAINPHICVAGGRDARMDWLKQRFWRIAKITEGKALVHGLAFVKYPEYLRLPVYSVDSVSWKSGVMWGLVRSFNPARGVVVTIAKRKKSIDRPKAKLLSMVNEYDQMLSRHNASQYRNDKSLVSGANAFAFLKGGAAILHQMRYSHRHGRHVFAVITQEMDIRLMAAIAPSLTQDFVFDYADARQRVDEFKQMTKPKRLATIELAFRHLHDTVMA